MLGMWCKDMDCAQAPLIAHADGAVFLLICIHETLYVQGTIVAGFVFGPVDAGDGDVLNAANVTLPDFLNASEYPPETMCRLRHAAVNPIFTSRSSELLLHALTTCGHSLALLPVPCGEVGYPPACLQMNHSFDYRRAGKYSNICIRCLG
jgi:hypothetical protein